MNNLYQSFKNRLTSCCTNCNSLHIPVHAIPWAASVYQLVCERVGQSITHLLFSVFFGQFSHHYPLLGTRLLLPCSLLCFSQVFFFLFIPDHSSGRFIRHMALGRIFFLLRRFTAYFLSIFKSQISGKSAENQPEKRRKIHW